MKDSKILGRKQCGNCNEFVGVRSASCVNCNSSFTKPISQESSTTETTETTQFTSDQLKMIYDAADFESARIKKELEECSKVIRKGLGLE